MQTWGQHGDEVASTRRHPARSGSAKKGARSAGCVAANDDKDPSFCQTCAFSGICLASGCGQTELVDLHGLVEHVGPFKRGEYIFRTGDPFRAIYAVRSGTVKTVIVTRDGMEQILGFHLPGEVVGLEGIYPERHPCDVVALEPTQLCRFSFPAVSTLASRLSSVQQHLFRMLSKELGGSLLLIGDHSADERIAAFLVDLCRRYEARGFSGTKFRLSMLRSDIANYLHLAAETVSRVFGRFRDQGVLRISGRHLEILDRERLRDMASCILND